MVSRKIKFLIPRDRGELVPIFFTLFLISVYVIFELSVILPTIYHNIFTYKEIFHLLFGGYAILNLLGNMYCCMITDTSIDTIICPVLLPVTTENASAYSHWHYCYQCEVNVPARSQHCFLCKRCILKRDHHCTFLGRCIGFRNVRYYMCFLLWSWIGLVYCNLLHMDYIYELLGTFSWRFIVACFFPWIAWFFSFLDHFSLLLSCICSTSIILSLYVGFLIIQQFYFIQRGQTWYEYKQNIHFYNVRRNMQTVFGKNWLLILFSPLITSQPIGDGMTFEMSK